MSKAHSNSAQSKDYKHTVLMSSMWKNLTDLAQSPDLNLIQHRWDELERKLQARPSCSSSVPDLMNALQNEWGKVSTEKHSDVSWKAFQEDRKLFELRSDPVGVMVRCAQILWFAGGSRFKVKSALKTNYIHFPFSVTRFNA